MLRLQLSADRLWKCVDMAVTWSGYSHKTLDCVVVPRQMGHRSLFHITCT